MKNVLVTGGCSRIGDHMCSGLLKKGYNVIKNTINLFYVMKVLQIL